MLRIGKKSKKLKTIISRIDNFSYSECVYFNLTDYPLELWYGPCPKYIFDIFRENLNDTDEFTLWEWTYSENSNQIYKMKPTSSIYFRA
jgi:hypothetical protein